MIPGKCCATCAHHYIDPINPRAPRAAMAAVAGLYRRVLPLPGIDFTCREGKEIFREALEDGTMEGFFKLIAHFQTQAEPAFCGLASLSMVLNSLSIDPGRKWKGPWRWFDESMLDCCEPLEKVKTDGISFAKVTCLGECSGARVEAVRASESSLEDFRSVVKKCCSSEDEHLIASYNRQLLKQTGTGHFSPIGGYHERRDMALILDVARFKYPPHWVPLNVLWDAVNTVDVSTGKSRGFMVVTKRSEPPSLLFTSSCKVENWRDVSRFLSQELRVVVRNGKMTSVEDVFSAILETFPGKVTGFVKWIVEVRRSNDESGKLDNDEMQRLTLKTNVLNQLRSTDMYKRLAGWLKSTPSCPCALSEKSLTDEVGEASCQGKSLLCGGLHKSKSCASCVSCKRMTRTTDGQGAGVLIGDGGVKDGNVQVIVPTGSCELHPTPVDVVTVLLLAQPSETWSEIPNSEVRLEFVNLGATDKLPDLLQLEVVHLQRQLRVLNCSDE
ncbi:glutathione gamma-glutamylcysteinyltransferase 2 isoform X3 [Selaginella moellendorffii]|nr:glutathione gamma-glutamylcysteinyltransferase 2 isoform X3 [Selaginella moellendorffii]|eukprot:XP_002976553.2 glutathione gamma-glutamylcysteinyltransferase 2 isoform X3 [Selaginella moellendorffii]